MTPLRSVNLPLTTTPGLFVPSSMRTRGPIQSEGVKRIPAKQLELVFQILCDWQDIVWWKVFCWLGPDVSCLSYSWIFPLLNAYVLLESFQKSFLNLKFPKSPERGNFDLREALESPYSFNYSRHLLSLSTESMTAW